LILGYNQGWRKHCWYQRGRQHPAGPSVCSLLLSRTSKKKAKYNDKFMFLIKKLAERLVHEITGVNLTVGAS